MLMAMTIILSACGPDASQAQAQHNRAQLDSELQRAREMGVPDSMLQPIVAQENKIASGQGGWGYSYSNAATNYAVLYNQVLGVEQQSGDILKQAATKNVDAFSAILTQRKSQGFTETSAYQARLTQAFQDLANAKTPGDYGKVSIFAQTQTQALTAMWPAYEKLQTFRTALAALKQVGIDTDWGPAAYTQDVEVFRDAATPDRYDRLGQVIDGQINQLVADRVQAMPYVGQAMLARFQNYIDTLKTFGESTGTFQKQHDDDAKQLASAKNLADYLTLSQIINHQTQQMTLPLIRGKARFELKELRAKIAVYQAQNPLMVYEYADPARGVGDVAGQFAAAGYSSDPVSAYSSAETQIWIELNNLEQMYANLSDPTPAWQPHAADLQLMNLYGIMHGQVTVVSLREQTARMYVNGKMVYWSYVTTGRFERPSPPGLHYAYWKAAHIEFQPTEPIGSPIRGYPTPINYAVYYADYGYFMHDAWWRVGFGPGSNLPHWDPAAFHGGSHGCVNFPLQNMAWYFNWVQVGSPILLY
jgi:hypothetical protein